LFESGFEIVDNFLREDAGIGKIVEVFKAFFTETEDVEARFVALMNSSFLKTLPASQRTATTGCENDQHCNAGAGRLFYLCATTSPAVTWGGLGSSEAKLSRTTAAAFRFDSSAPPLS
jgi:hypothetical protein